MDKTVETVEESKIAHGSTYFVGFFKDGTRGAGGVRIYPTGEVAYEGDYAPSDAAATFWDHVRDTHPGFRADTNTKALKEANQKIATLDERLEATSLERDDLHEENLHLSMILREMAEDRDQQHEMAETRLAAVRDLEEENTALRAKLEQASLADTKKSAMVAKIKAHLATLIEDGDGPPE